MPDRPIEAAEQELLDLIRLEDVRNFSVTIRHDEEEWSVIVEAHDEGKSGVGRGPTFEDAWSDVVAVNLRRGR